MKAMGHALTEMNSLRNEIWDQNGKELEALVFRVTNYAKILGKVTAEISRRDNYRCTIEQLMEVLIKVQS
jgi:hypothetical protein